MPITVKCLGCGHVLFNEKRANLLKVLNDFENTACPKCGRNLQSPDLNKLVIAPLGKPTRQTFQTKKVYRKGSP